MIYIVIGLVVLLIAISVVAFINNRLYKKYKNNYEKEMVNYKNLQEEYSKLAQAYKIKKENKEKADEKISDLHSGTVSADDILPKRKSRK